MKLRSQALQGTKISGASRWNPRHSCRGGRQEGATLRVSRDYILSAEAEIFK